MFTLHLTHVSFSHLCIWEFSHARAPSCLLPIAKEVEEREICENGGQSTRGRRPCLSYRSSIVHNYIPITVFGDVKDLDVDTSKCNIHFHIVNQLLPTVHIPSDPTDMHIIIFLLIRYSYPLVHNWFSFAGALHHYIPINNVHVLLHC